MISNLRKGAWAAALALAAAIPASAAPQRAAGIPGLPTPDQTALHRHIANTMSRTVRTTPTDTLGNFALPLPYSVPCVKGGFQNMFYWDTYFTNAGLLADGDIWQARNNIEDIAAMIERFGYMPNATAKSMLNRSQPPLLAAMVADYYAATSDKALLRRVLPALEKEYAWWMKNRKAPNGLNRYGHSATDAELVEFFNAVAPRVGIDPSKVASDAERRTKGAHLMAEAESGWDFNPRFAGECMNYNPVDLNAILYGYETNLGSFYRALGKKGAAKWDKLADTRRKLMQKYLVDPQTHLYHDYNFATSSRSPIYSAAAFTPFWMGAADKTEAAALVASLPKLEGKGGIMTCTPGDRTVTYQWDAPNGWAPVQFYAIKALDRYGYSDDAARIARKYVDAQTAIYNSSKQLWEKYNASEGSSKVANEYPMPGDFMGWTAGAYQTAYRYLYGPDTPTDAPRVVNVLNFVRFTEPRRKIEPVLAWITDSVLLDCVGRQIALMNKYDIKGTFLLQYDALIQPEYQKLMKDSVLPGTEIGGWWEITQPHVEAAGLKWRGRFPWDWHANVGFSTGYTPAEREKLVDVYMAKFKEIFGYYPKSVASWFIDSHSLDYMRRKYGIEASASCRDQIGTDGYNMWGGYWGGGYYPSKKNFYVPAQTKGNQIDVPVFRLLGSDPIAQYDSGLGGHHQGVYTLEPVYGHAGGSKEWIDWFFEKMVYDPAMGMTYTQAGQENMFTWPRMHKGLEYQFPLIARLARKGDIKLETLAETGRNFRKANPMTPPSALSAMTDYDKKGEKTVWFNSRNYRLNLMWQKDRMFVRDIHLFDENQESLYLKEPCPGEACHYWTLPVVDGNVWSNDSVRGAIRFYKVLPSGESRELTFGAPQMANDGKTLTLTVPAIGEGCEMVITLDENHADFTLRPSGAALKPELMPRWYAVLEHGANAEMPFGKVSPDKVEARFKDFDYTVKVANATLGDCSTQPRTPSGVLRAFTLTPDTHSITFLFNK